MVQKKPVPYRKVIRSTKRICVRPYKLTDFSVCVASVKNQLPKVNKFDEPIPTAIGKNYSEFKKRIERHRRHGKIKTHFIFGIFDRKTSALIGQVDLFVINSQLQWGNLGYHIHNQYWGKGYATEAARLALNIAFNELKFHRIEAATETANKASIGVAVKSGMKFEGTRIKFFPDNGGIDMVVYGANAIDYK